MLWWGVMVELAPSTRLVPGKHVHVREFDGELVVLDLKKGEYYALRDVGALAWQRIEEGRSLQEIAEEVAASYDVGVALALNDLLVLGNEWIGHGLVERAQG